MQIATCRIQNVTENLQLIHKADLDNNLGFETTLVDYLRLSEAFSFLSRKYKVPTVVKYTGIEQFLNLKKRVKTVQRNFRQY
jgi:ribosomal protein S15P/S13E